MGSSPGWSLAPEAVVYIWSLPEAEASSYHLCTRMPHFIDFFSELLDGFLGLGSTWKPSSMMEEKPRCRRNVMRAGPSWARILHCVLRQITDASELLAKSG